jgi:MerR family transcriptional regulator, copper efflux regulator
MSGLTIGEVAEQANVHIETLRYYERRGLVARPPRSASNYRRYPEEAVRRVRFIKRAQELGFSLNNIKELLSLRADPEAGCHEILAHTEAKMKDMDAKICALTAMKYALSTLVAECSG